MLMRSVTEDDWKTPMSSSGRDLLSDGDEGVFEFPTLT